MSVLRSKKVLFPILSTVIIAIIALGAMFGYRAHINSKVEAGEKRITIEVIADSHDYKESYRFWTEEGFLGDVLIYKGIVTHYDGTKGLRYITGVDGIESDFTNQEWWSITINGEAAAVGMDVQAITHNDTIILELKIGWN